MARDRIYTSSQYRGVVDELKKNDVLGLNIVEGKDIFMLAVAFIALTQIASLIKQVKPDKLALIFERLTFIDVILIVLTGIISILPMLNYDRILNKLVGTHFPIGELLKTSWLINTINNIAGFGGAVSIGLRSQYYGKESKEKLLSNISKVFFFALSGLSIYGLIGYTFIKLGKVDEFLAQYSPWLIGAAAYSLQGDCYVNLEKYNEAIASFDKAISESDDNDIYTPLFMMKQARVYRELKDYAKEAAVYEKIKKEYPAYAGAYQIDIDKYIERAKASKAE
mgnify:CR=1 FL=1